MIEMLARRPHAVHELAEHLPISRPAVSRHLRVLERAALVQSHPQGRHNIFQLRQEGFDAARQWLGDFWDEALARFAMVAENTPEEP